MSALSAAAVKEPRTAFVESSLRVLVVCRTSPVRSSTSQNSTTSRFGR